MQKNRHSDINKLQCRCLAGSIDAGKRNEFLRVEILAQLKHLCRIRDPIFCNEAELKAALMKKWDILISYAEYLDRIHNKISSYEDIIAYIFIYNHKNRL